MFSAYSSSAKNASRKFLGGRINKNVPFRFINWYDLHFSTLKRIPGKHAVRRNNRQYTDNNSFKITKDVITSAVKDSALKNNSSLSKKRSTSIPKIIILVLGTASVAITGFIAVIYYRFSKDNKERSLFIPLWINPNILGKGCLKFPNALKYIDHEAYEDFTKEPQNSPNKIGGQDVSHSVKEDNIRQYALEKLLLNPSIRRLLRVPTKLSLELKQNHFWVETEKPTIHGVQVSFSESYPFCINVAWLIKFFEPFLIVSDAVGFDVLKLDEMLTSEDISIEPQESTGDNYHRNKLKYYNVYSLGEYQLYTESHIQEATLHYKGCIDFDHPTMNNGFKVTQLVLFVKDNDKSVKYKIV